jgi:predicted ATPase
MIERLYVHNYRCLENFTLDLGGRSSALLIGKNGSGKSTVLDALRLLQSICRRAGRVGKLVAPRDFTRYRTEIPMRFELDVRLGRKQYRYRLSLEWLEDSQEARIVDEHFAVDGHVIFNRNIERVQLADGAEFRLDWHVFALPIMHETPGERTIAAFKSFLATMVLVSPIPKLMTGFSEGESNELDGDASNFADCLRGLLTKKPAAYTAFHAAIKETIPDFSSLENVERGEKGARLVVQFEDCHGIKLSVDFDSLSDGEKCFCLSAYLIAAYGAGLVRCCIWDEPDAHLAFAEVGQLIIALRKAVYRDGQFVATSHHPETMRSFPEDATFVLAKQSHLNPAIVRLLSEIEYRGDLVDALLRDEVIGQVEMVGPNESK